MPSVTILHSANRDSLLLMAVLFGAYTVGTQGLGKTLGEHY
jgi:hypothetical protein